MIFTKRTQSAVPKPGLNELDNTQMLTFAEQIADTARTHCFAVASCAESIDIESYNTCIHGCCYCYANYNMDNVRFNHSLYDANSPLLCSTISPDDKVTKRAVKSLVDDQIGLL